MTVLHLALLGCVGDKAGDSTPPADSGRGLLADSGGPASDSGDTDDTEEPLLEGTITGDVTVQLYTTDDDGELVYVSWTDAYEDVWMFGDIWVTAYSIRDDGGQEFHGSYAIASPSTAENPYAINAAFEEETRLLVYAQVDYWGEGILGSSDPLGVYNEVIVLSDGESASDVDITVLIPYYDFDAPGGGGGCSETMTVSGDLVFSTGDGPGNSVAMLNSTSGVGPYHYTKVASDGNSERPYALTSCASYGEMELIGATDVDGDDLFTPMDLWGSYVSEPDVSGNPIDIEGEDLSGMDIQIPLNEGGSPFEIIPFVTVGGEVSSLDGSFDDLGATDVYVAALKYRPSEEITATYIEESSYDYAHWSASDLSGLSEAEFSLNVPANTIVYVWAYADMDGDGSLNEPEEPVVSYGTEGTGRHATGTTSVTDANLALSVP